MVKGWMVYLRLIISEITIFFLKNIWMVKGWMVYLRLIISEITILCAVL